MRTGWFSVFLTVVLGIWTLMHLYAFWRASSIPLVATHLSRRSLALIALLLWTLYPLSRFAISCHWEALSKPLEWAGATWIGILFLGVSMFLAVDIVTAGGWLWPRMAPALRSGAAIVAGTLCVLAIIQGLRPPSVRDYEVTLPGLPRERDGLTLVEISDLHLGNLVGREWLARLIDRINGLKPDLVVVNGDLVDRDLKAAEHLLPILKTLRAPLGVWAVTGNHEFYSGLEQSTRLIDAAGFSLLRDRWTEVAPGLVLAGVDDLTARRLYNLPPHPIERALANHPPGAVILLSHSPLQADAAAAAGAGLMLSAHTHNGQIWPFNYLVRTSYPFMEGRYSVDGMTLIVCRGTGTWGPRMRLWHRGEILRIRLRRP
jgi:predicted MPP superfamily phosphohydrolase